MIWDRLSAHARGQHLLACLLVSALRIVCSMYVAYLVSNETLDIDASDSDGLFVAHLCCPHPTCRAPKSATVLLFSTFSLPDILAIISPSHPLVLPCFHHFISTVVALVFPFLLSVGGSSYYAKESLHECHEQRSTRASN